MKPTSTELFLRNWKVRVDRRGLTVHDLMKKTGLSRETVDNALRGKINATLRTCDKLAAAVHAPVWKLLKEQGDDE